MKDGTGTPQSVVVFGGGSDIGQAIAQACVREGARAVVLAARRPETLEAPLAQLRSAGAAVAEAVAFDAEATHAHADVLAEVARKVGDVDLAVVAFGVLPDQEGALKDPSVALEAARVNYLGAMSILLALAQRMREQGHGDIVVLSSVAAERGRRSNFVYGSTKAGLDTFCQGLSDDLHGTGVRLLVVRPGFVRSKMTRGLQPVPLSTTPAAVAAATLHGLRSGAMTVWVPSTLRWVMTVLRHLPRPLFRRLEI
ncbi:MAG: decaprenylphospho-beta-D-erythro-pentofuranosid-2-ulose 2-reductase [Actinomycetota bacterium]